MTTQGSGQFGGPKTVKRINFDNKGLISGIDKLANAVSSTLGAAGRTVVIEDDFGNAHVTKDGVTVAESILLRDSVENLGCTMLKQAAKQTASKAGDGTTTSTVLAQAIIHNALPGLEEGESFRHINEGIQSAKENILKTLDEIKVEVKESDLSYVAQISANNDKVLGETIAQAFEEAGEHGIVTVEKSDTSETSIDTTEGTLINSTCVVPHFYTDMDKQEAVLEKPLIFFSATKIPNVKRIQSMLEEVITKNRSLLIVAECDEHVVSALAMNKVKGNIKVNIVNPVSFGQKKTDLLDDLSLLFGGKVYDESMGDSLDSITIRDLGECDKTVSDSEGTLFYKEDMSEGAKERVKDLQAKLEEADNPFSKRHIQVRLALLTGGVSIIKVGADSEIELKEKLDRVDDAVHAVKAAKKDGIVAGGGSALRYIADNYEITSTGEAVLIDAIKAPYSRILQNAGLCPCDFEPKTKEEGVNVISGKVENMFEAGVVDPVMVTKQAIQNAVSVASTILSTDAVISNIRIDE